MYSILITLHSALRWLVLASLLYAACRAYLRYRQQKTYTPADDKVRHWTATFAHIQLLTGMVLYTQSPLIKQFWKSRKAAMQYLDLTFYGLIHALMMLSAIVVITIGSAMAKRKPSDREKFKTMFAWFAVGLIIILVAVPWPFSPLSKRPYFR